ncbi:MAG: class I SAM-dependent methyltransferase, partial [Deltaproteobacteria bacterium]|nr:class I SAM-dependent methyltransferase [Deltaproteobacteria bacterium]
HIKEPIIADLGSGAGFPAIPFALTHPDSFVFMIERSHNKCEFLRHVLGLLGLTNFELLEKDPLRQTVHRFDAVISRAFSPRKELIKILRIILADKGRFYYMQTVSAQEFIDTLFSLEETYSSADLFSPLYLNTYVLTPQKSESGV